MTADRSSDEPEIPPAYKNKGDLTKGDLKAHLVRLSVPMMWGIGAIITMQLVDMYYISLLGTEPLAAVSFTFPVTFGIFSFIMGFGIAMSSVTARLIGGGEKHTQQRVTTHGLLLVGAIALFVSMLGAVSQEVLFTLMGAEQALLPIILDYMTIWYLGLVFIAIPMVGNAAIRASGDTLTQALIMGSVALLNIVLDPLLIFGLFGFPRLEVEGAAWATVISYAMAVLVGLYVLYARKQLISLHYLYNLKEFGNSAKRLLFIALPAGLTNTIQPFVNAVIVALLSSGGAEAVAAYGIVSRIEAFAFIVIMGVAVGMGPIIGQNWGAGRYDRVNETLRLAIRFAMIYSFGVAILLILFAEPIAGLFSQDKEVVRVAALFFWIVPLTYAFANLVNGWASAFNAMGMPQRSFAMIVIKMLVLMLPAVYIGNMLFGIPGLFAAIALVNVSAGIVIHFVSWRSCHIRTRHGQ